MPHDLAFLGNIHIDFAFTGNLAVDTAAGVLCGRPYGGVALLWRKSLLSKVSVIKCSSVRIAAIKVSLCDRDMQVFSVYMPTNSSDNLAKFTDCLSEIAAVIDSNGIEAVFILSDYNAHTESYSIVNYLRSVRNNNGYVLILSACRVTHTLL